jgi:hypothetical protein
MQHAVALSGEDDENVAQISTITDVEPGITQPTKSESVKLVFSYAWFGIKSLFHLLRPSTIRHGYNQLHQMTFKDLIKHLFSLLIVCLRLLMMIVIYTFRYVNNILLSYSKVDFVCAM